MSSRQWFILYNESIRGPFTSGQLRMLAQRAQITPDVQVRLGENGKWRPAMSVHGLFDGVGQPGSDKAFNKFVAEEIASSGGASASSELSSDDLSQSVPEIRSLEESPIAGPVPPMMNPPVINPPMINSPGAVGELRSEAPPLPGSEGTPPPTIPNMSANSSFGEMRSEAPPLPGSEGAIPPVAPPPQSPLANVFSFIEKKKGAGKIAADAVPKLIKTLLASDEKILYAAHPAFIVLVIQNIINAIVYLFVGLIPAIVMYASNDAETGIGYGLVATLVFSIWVVINYIRWQHACYVITNTRTFVKNGVFSVEVGYIFNSNIQMLRVRTGFIDRLLGLNTIELRTAAGALALRWTPLTTVLPFYGK